MSHDDDVYCFSRKYKRARANWLVLPADATLVDLHEKLHEQYPEMRLRYYPTDDPSDDPWCQEDPEDHSYEFRIGDLFYWPIGEDDDSEFDDVRSADVPLSSLGLAVKQDIRYTWDMGTPVGGLLRVERMPQRVTA